MPPVFTLPVLSEMVELLTVSVPWLYMPPTKLARLPEMVELLTVSVPALCMPPPTPAAPTLPLATVRLFRVSFAPLSTWNTREAMKLPAVPFTVMLALPPSMISPALSVMGRRRETRLEVDRVLADANRTVCGA
jgi:hypothetical protein